MGIVIQRLFTKRKTTLKRQNHAQLMKPCKQCEFNQPKRIRLIEFGEKKKRARVERLRSSSLFAFLRMRPYSASLVCFLAKKRSCPLCLISIDSRCYKLKVCSGITSPFPIVTITTTTTPASLPNVHIGNARKIPITSGGKKGKRDKRKISSGLLSHAREPSGGAAILVKGIIPVLQLVQKT